MDPDDVAIVSVRKAGGEWSFVARIRGGSAPMDPAEWRGPFDPDGLIAELKRMGLPDAAAAEKVARARVFMTTITERPATAREMELLHRLTGR